MVLFSPEAAVESYNLYHNRTEVKNGSIGPDIELIKQNTIWHSQLLASPEQQGFLRRIHEIPDTLLVVHDTVTHMMQNSNICWVLMTIDSIVGDEGEIELAKKVGAAFYERCSGNISTSKIVDSNLTSYIFCEIKKKLDMSMSHILPTMIFSKTLPWMVVPVG